MTALRSTKLSSNYFCSATTIPQIFLILISLWIFSGKSVKAQQPQGYWEPIFLFNDSLYGGLIADVACSPSGKCIGVIYQGTRLNRQVRSIDSGRTWQLASLPLFDSSRFFSAYSIEYPSDSLVIAAYMGMFNRDEALIARSIDGGATWMSYWLQTAGFFPKLLMYDDKRGTLEAGDSVWGFMRTEDGGETWQHTVIDVPMTPMWDTLTPSLWSAEYTAPHTLYAIVRTDYAPKLLSGFRSTDNGVTWTQVNPLVPINEGEQFEFQNVQFFDSLHGVLFYSIRRSSDLLKGVAQTADGGLHWEQIYLDQPSLDVLPTVHMLDTAYGIAFTAKKVGRVAHGGRTWTQDSVQIAPCYQNYTCDINGVRGNEATGPFIIATNAIYRYRLFSSSVEVPQTSASAALHIQHEGNALWLELRDSRSTAATLDWMIVDIQGKRIEHGVLERNANESYRGRCELARLMPGSYFVVVHWGDRTVVQPLRLVQ